MPQIRKVLNTSVILAGDSGDQEYIVLQKGIGYGRRPGEEVEVSEGSRIFLPAEKTARSQLIELLEEIPPEYLAITRRVVEYAEGELGTSLSRHIYLALTDHLHFAVERLRSNIVITNRVFWEMKTFYAREYRIGLYALDQVEEALGVRLPDEEAANVAFHIVNALNESGSQFDAMRAAALIGKVMTVVTYSMNYSPDRESVHFSRFLSHMQYFAERFFNENMLDSPDDFLYLQIESGYPRAIACAEKIRTLLIKEYDRAIPNEEVAYLAVHIQRLASR